MKKIVSLMSVLLLAGACMKSKNEYRQAIEDVQREEYNDAVEAQQQRQEQQHRQDQQEERRSRGSNDREGMGMDE